ncbi:MAG TPA: P1 family peptidase [Gemmatimonadaceae bacterium]|nr:P1 family peptidase [Gemmatimonadaceae bacterium]
MKRSSWIVIALVVSTAGANGQAESRPRARTLGIPFDGTPGPLNAITDVKGVAVGHTTLIEREGPKTVRTGVTAILPANVRNGLFASTFVVNGNGEWIGTIFIEETGLLYSPIMFTNTISIGTVRDAVVKWSRQTFGADRGVDLPVVGETWDGFLNDIYGFHVKEEHVFSALNSATTGAVAEGNVGGGTGMRCYQFKCGIGTASRVVRKERGGYTVGVLVQANFGIRRDLRVAGIPVGNELSEQLMPEQKTPDDKDGSILIVVATDAPLLPHQLKRVAKRAALGLARNGSIADTDSGDLILAFSTAATNVFTPRRQSEVAPNTVSTVFLREPPLDNIFEATVQATEEAIINALVAGKTMTGINGNRVHAIPHDKLREVLRRHNRLQK